MLAGHPYRVPARRFGYLLRMVKERYKDDSLDIADAGAKVKALINEHLIDLGINPKIPPIELLSRRLHRATCSKHSAGESGSQGQRDGACHPQALHRPLRRGPGVLQELSEKLEKLIEQHQDNWELLAESLEKLRARGHRGAEPAIEG